MSKPHILKRPGETGRAKANTGAIKLSKPSKTNTLRQHGAGLLSDRALTQLFAARPHWRHV